MWRCVVLLLLVGCASAPATDVEFSIRNSTLEPLVIKVGNKLFATSIVLAPGQSWSGVINPRWLSSGSVEIVPLLRAK
jgi:hypothetical protein